MIDFKNFSAIQTCLDEYMSLAGKNEINDMEANRELARAGLLDDSLPNPGKPLRLLLAGLRDANLCLRILGRYTEHGLSGCLRR